MGLRRPALALLPGNTPPDSVSLSLFISEMNCLLTPSRLHCAYDVSLGWETKKCFAIEESLLTAGAQTGALG